ncbi:phosphonatase-like hydrolase [Sinomonas sp. ASV322]|uniref:phosphonatase-like hydrolase n=1 Tax=Sinomonas sp. ASV322 TaxID=3041920 RepID=UPI0027DC4B87|nr:phosphonatase-like hydrolase [Sinomonas sp. ASV322]MDQ4502607.1 phosphonatase-like hydrolase [Sinomonas sp. ASV322]
MIQLAAFDIAGTTVDDHGHVYRALEDAVRENGVDVRAEDLQTWMGADKIEAIRALLRLGGYAGVDAADVERTVAATFAHFRTILAERYAAEPPTPFPGVVEALAELRGRGIKVALTTGFSRDVAAPLLESIGWTVGEGPEHTLDALVTTSDVAAGRPAPYMIHRAMEKTGVLDVSAVLAAGDTVVDVQAARNAGAIAVGVLTGKLTREEFASQPGVVVLESVADVPALEVTRT